jgi:hypothetical protein
MQTDASDTLWTIPLCVKTAGEEKPQWVMMKERELTIEKPGELYLLNAETNGFCVSSLAFSPSILC